MTTVPTRHGDDRRKYLLLPLLPPLVGILVLRTLSTEIREFSILNRIPTSTKIPRSIDLGPVPTNAEKELFHTTSHLEQKHKLPDTTLTMVFSKSFDRTTNRPRKQLLDGTRVQDHDIGVHLLVLSLETRK